MKITPEDMEAVRITMYSSITWEDANRDVALGLILVGIYDRGYQQALADQADVYKSGDCPYDNFSHTREWCGYRDCRES